MTYQFDITAIIICSVVSLIVAMVGMFCGFVMGRFYTLTNEPKKLQMDRERTLGALLRLLDSTEQLNEGVDTHNTELAQAKEEIESQSSADDNDLFDIQSRLVSNIARVVESNRKMENELVVSQYEIERQADELDRTRKEARTDGLCDIGNRMAYEEAIQFMISRYQGKDVPFGLMLVDIDHFKRVNDTFGHAAGDEVLINIGKALKECVRPEDVVCRIGGDEFAILLEGLTDENSDAVGKRISSTIETYDFSVGSRNQRTVVTMSMGLAPAKKDDSADTLYTRSDTALYRSKELGRNRLQIMKTVGTESLKPEEEVLEEARQISYEDIKASFMEDDAKLNRQYD